MSFDNKDDALDALERARKEWVEEARNFAVNLGSDGRIVTIEDIRRDGPPIPEGADPRVAGAVFRCKKTWEGLGYTAGKRRTSHKRPVAMYVLRGEA